jgi:hypothetical protein
MYAEHPLFRPTRFPVLIPRFCQYALKKTVRSGRRIPCETRPPQIPACSFSALGSLQS